jgi:collagen beta-1,O-galactosyltransferase
MVKKNHSRVLILEDDAYIEPSFNQDIVRATSEADRFVPNWDLMFAGRKVLTKADEAHVEGASHLVWPSYSHWTVSYALTLSGAQKLLDDKPLAKMIALDEYIPIMYGKNDNKQWLHAFQNRELVALSADPLLVHPQLYTGEPGYYTDTEASVVIDPLAFASARKSTVIDVDQSHREGRTKEEF